jgi:endonuclease/exonuclease/phosphatase family metal-dependent hydrolase
MNRTFERRMVAALIAALAAIAAIAPLADAHRPSEKHTAGVTVMTRNLYLGTDLTPIALSPTLAVFEQRAAAGFAQVQATDFPARAELIAREVRRTNPDLIGLQEAALWRTGPKDGAATPATDVAFDYLAILDAALNSRGLDYDLVTSTQEADIEAPTAAGIDIRLTMRDAILARDDRKLDVVASGGGNYATTLVLPTVAGSFTSTRGFAFADVRVGGRRVRFVDTHLESIGNPIRTAQAQELVGPGGPLAGVRTAVLVGDVNSDPNGPEPEAWQAIVAGGLTDVWPALYPTRPGFTCCTGPALMDPPTPSPFDSRIDDVFVKGDVRPLNARLVGVNPATSRTDSGPWASDHGGLVAKLKLK